MKMDDAVGTITQVLSIIDRTPISYESVRPALENALNHKRSRREFAVRQLYHANVLAPPDRAKLPDYIEVIPHCKGVARAPVLRLSTRPEESTMVSDHMRSDGGKGSGTLKKGS